MIPLVLLAVLATAPAVAAPAPAARSYLVERFGAVAVARLYAPGFATLSKEDKLVAWHLTLAAHAGETIQYDQLGWNGVAVKGLLEAVYQRGHEGKAGTGSFDRKFTEYLTRFYGNLGNHDEKTSQKFLPGFTPDELALAAKRAQKAGAPLGVKDEAALDAWLAELRPTLFDPSFGPLTTSKTPAPGKDILTSSSNTCYGRDVTLQDLSGFKEKYPLNSRVVKQHGKLVEQVFRAGTPDRKVAPGLYADELSRVIVHLQAAAKHAKKDQAAALTRLVRYFQTGAPADWDAYNIAWLKADTAVDANIGFIESYVDPRGQKGQWEALVNYRDPAENKVMELIGRNAQYFEDQMPWPAQYRRKKVAPPVAKAVSLVAAYPQPPAGINLPNEQAIREKYGSKSVLVANSNETGSALKRLPLAIEFSRTPEDREEARRYSATARKWLVAFHEVVGHGSGQVDPKLKGEPSKYLKEYDNTLEEARADLVALWHATDPKLVELSPDHERIARQMYRDILVEALTDLANVEKGDELEEDHQRAGHLISGFLIEQGAAKQVVEGGRTYWTVVDYPKMREAVGALLTRLMVIKATGDYAGVQALVQRLGVKFDPKLRDEVVARVKAANVPSSIFLVSPRLVPVLDEKGAVKDVELRDDQGFIEQHLERAALGRAAPGEATKLAAGSGSSK
ncbi:MAG: dipeptidyl-peptidase 3 family protein [Myxococcaceae bacterium]